MHTSILLPKKIINKEWITAQLRYLIYIILLATIYYAVACLGLFLEDGQRAMVPISLPSGVALTALLLFGIHIWPGILLGVLAINWSMDMPFLLSLFQAFGNVSQAVVATWLLHHFHFQTTLTRTYDVLLLVIAAFMISSLLGASISVTGLFILKNIPFDYLGRIWFIDWFRNGIGALVVTSSLLVWQRLPTLGTHANLRLLELILLLVGLAVASGVSLKATHHYDIVLLYTIFPFAIWAALRFEQHGATLAIMLVSGILLNGSLRHPAYNGMFDICLEIGFLGIIALTSLIIAAFHSEHLQKEQQLQQEKNQTFAMLRSMADGFITTDANGHIDYLNPIAEFLTGWSHAKSKHKPLNDIFRLKSVGNAEQNPIERNLQGVMTSPRLETLINRNAQEIPIEVSIAPIREEEGKINGAVIVFREVHETQHQPTYDVLTGIYDRREFEYQLKQVLQNKSEVAFHSLLYLDIDQFRVVNTTYGQVVGDLLLKQVAATIQARIRTNDILARLGGDEFGVLLRNCSIENAKKVAESFLKVLHNAPFVWQDKVFEMGMSIGIAPITEKDEHLHAIVGRASLACCAVQESGGDNIHLYDPEGSGIVYPRGKQRSNHILQALEEERFVLYQQPIVSIKLATNALNEIELESDPKVARFENIHHEVLLRLRDEQDVILLPSTFLPIAERYQLMPRLDRWVVRKAFALAPTFLADNPKISCITINISTPSINDNEFIPYILAATQKLTVSTDFICFEIAEATVISHFEKSKHFMEEMSQLGFRLALDNFGQGVSSFGYLRQLPLHYLKIDGHFIKDMNIDSVNRVIVELIALIGNMTNLQVIAEWVEDESILVNLKAMGIDFAQGFWIAKPEPFELTHH